ncbi:ABC transporter permease (plasmid) [Shinella sp. PSBB067]|uniref:ABC transporter permease n=1 Tax=unclassified Shinella TaxID=2643062 RepID=UPI000928D94F|nr:MULTISPECIES: ABC transporter permease [unclassified Shinella]MBN9055905.1 ABC transporter permease [Hyphomicrobiales bacterium]OJV03220.1 MAG: polyamine ABC transporter permease [Shinella sp. 65-6]QRI61533.1 ABC transporter permease [Shinella sp. PSBB067]
MPTRITRFAFATLAILFLVAPLVAILPLAFTSSVILTYPVPAWSMRWFIELFTADAWKRAIVNSLIVGTGTTLLATTLGTAASLGLRNRGLLLRGAFRTLFLLPMVVPAVVLGVGMQVLLARFGLTNSYAGVIIAHTVVAVPFVVVSVTGALAGIDERVELAAQSLGASPATVFRRVTLPLAMPGVLSGAVLAFATSLDEVVLTLFVAGPNQRTLARQMFSSIRENISPAIAAAAFLFIAATLLIGLAVVLSRSMLARRR